MGMSDQLLIQFIGNLHPEPIEIQIDSNADYALISELFQQSSDAVDESVQ